MMFPALPSLTDRFAWLINGLCRAIGVGVAGRQVEAALAWAIWNRVRALGERFIAIAERVQAGRIVGRRRVAPPRVDGEKTAARTASKPAATLRGEFGWVRRMLPETAQFAGVLYCLLRDPDLVAVVEKAPGAARTLRPLCHLLGVQAPEFLRRRRGEIPAPAPACSAEAEATQAIREEDTPSAPSPPSAGEDANDAEATRTPSPVAPPVQPPSPPRPPPGGLAWDGRRWFWL